MAPTAAAATAAETQETSAKRFWALALGSIGVVFGDIGTSPLYALRESVAAAKTQGATGPDAVLGILSLVVWTLVLIVTVKYVLVLLNADNKGEGGTFALMALGQSVAKRSSFLILVLGVAGAAFFYGDAVITPAISVLSAVEGLKLVAPHMDTAVLPVTVAILVALFAVQSRGTEAVAQFFGPIMLAWFATLAIGGLVHLIDDPRVFLALNPVLGAKFILTHGVLGMAVMGLVFLAVTGAEALYADLGHFGRKPIQASWLCLVLPALILNYFGQGALLLARPEAIENPFYRLYPGWALLPMVVLATVATVIASQAVITGAFSFTRQAIQLGLVPRLTIRHTSESVAGQIYLPRVNQLLFIGVLIVTLSFRSSSDLAAAYGVSVTATMVIDSLMAFFVVWRCWHWPVWKAAVLMVPLLLIEQSFLTANMLKIAEGGWLPLLIGGAVALLMLTWVRGTASLARVTRKNEADLDWLVRKLDSKPPHRVSGTAVFLTGDPTAAPTSLMHNLKHNRVLHERNVILTIKTEDVPRVPRHERIEIDRVADTFIRVIAHYGFMETPSVPKIIEQCRRKDLNIDISATSFFLSRRSLKTTMKSEMPGWQERLFIWLAGRAEDATEYFRIPSDRVVEVGTQVTV
ncbi:MAG TPA: potassium transporter Kup [Hyphomicrobiaceae bacterium]|jgi:KUP system potassium uptake protein|nr:potassium transporter Kup [Hyphomicrobiaceae bacterium]